MKRNIILYNLLILLIVSNIANISFLNNNFDITLQQKTETNYDNNLITDYKQSETDTQLTSTNDDFIEHEQNNVNIPKQTLDTETWYLGESVDTTIEFNRGISEESKHSTYINFISESKYDYNVKYEYIYDWVKTSNSDNNLAYFGFELDPAVSYTYVGYSVGVDYRFYIPIYCGGSGNLYYDMYAYHIDTNGDESISDTITNSIHISNDLLDYEGYLYLKIAIYFSLNDDNSAYDKCEIRFYYYSTVIGDYVKIDEGLTNTFLASDFYTLLTIIDELSFLRDDINNYIRSEYQYASATTIIHRLDIPSVPYAKQITISAPIDWTYSSISPSATVTKSGSDYIIESPTELTYYIYFVSNSSNLLAIEDVSTD